MFYSDTLFSSFYVLAAYIAIFWIVVCGSYWVYEGFDTSIFFTSYIPPRTPQEAAAQRTLRQQQEAQEEKIIKKDLTRNVKISTLLAKSESTKSTEQLLQLGIALNQTLSQQDADNEAQGDHWLSYYRWAWFMLYQLVVGGAIILVTCLFLPDPNSNAALGLVVSIFTGVYYGSLMVKEKHRVRIGRFGGHVSFLRSGFQMRVPLIEENEGFTLANMVWGPGRVKKGDEEGKEYDEEELDEFHLGGSTGDLSNPQPGIIKIALHATYDLYVIVKIVLRVRRASMADWYRYTYEFANQVEIGETIADITRAVLTTRAREIFKNVSNDKVLDSQTAKAIAERLMSFIDSVPEITGQILLALYEVSRERLGGILPVSVAITSVEPSESFKDLLLRLDTAQVDREVSVIDGLGTAERWEQIVEGASTLTKKHGPELVFSLLNTDIGLEVAQQQSPFDQWFKTFLIPQLKTLTGPQKDPQEKTKVTKT